ncbi:acetamidase/formamidase family protein [Leptolyngbya sp. FACHB-1515]|uniref:acetamidase/formamidase family protein n=1 Tax=Leptolyngbya sp. FACHB-1515 TaxID=2933931 RepID=UPI003297E890
MASLNQVLPGVSIEEITRLRVDNPGRGPHSVTGPIFVEGAQPGDVLKVRINRIVPRTYGANWNLPGSLNLGQFPTLLLNRRSSISTSILSAALLSFYQELNCLCVRFPASLASHEPKAASTAPFHRGRLAATWTVTN